MADIKNTLCNSSDKNLMSEEKKNVTVSDQSNQQLTYKVDMKSKKCTLCEKILSTVCSLRRHLQTVHKLKRTNTTPLASTSSLMVEWATNVETSATSGSFFCLPNKTQPLPAQRIKPFVTDNSMSKHMKKNEIKSINLSRPKQQTKYQQKDQNKCFLCNKILSGKYSLKRHLLAIHKIAMNDLPSTSLPCHSIKQKTYDNDSTIKNNLVHNLKNIHTNCGPNVEQNTMDISSKVQTCNNIMPLTINTFSMSDELSNSSILQSHSINTQNKCNSINPSPQANKLQTVPIQNNETHVVNGWPNKTQESQAQSYKTVAMYRTDMFDTNTCITKPSFDQFAKSCFIPNNKQKLLKEKIITQVPIEKNMLLDLPVIEQNYNKMLLSMDDTIDQPNKNRFPKTYINKTRGAINKINDQSNMTNNVQMYSNGTEIIADTITESYNQNKQQSFNKQPNNIEDVFVVGWPNETLVNQIQSDQTLQNCHSHVCNICSMLFPSQQSLTEHKQEVHSKNNVHRDMVDFSNIEKNITPPTEVTMDSYYESGQSNEVHIVQTYNNEIQLDVNAITVNEESNKMQMFQNYSNETQINTCTTSVLCQSNDDQAVQTDNNKTHISMDDWPNKMQEIQAENEQTITLYKGQLLFDKPNFETHDPIDQNKVLFWSSEDNKKNLSTNEFKINTDTTDVAYQLNETQTKQIHNNRTNVLINSWPNESQRILNHSNQSMNQHKAQPLNTNAIRPIRTSFVDWSEVSNKPNNDTNKNYVCSEQVKHKQEIHSPKQQMLEKKINPFPVDINMMNLSFVQKSHTSTNETLSYIDPNSQLNEEMPQISNYETQPVTNSYEFYDNLHEIDILQSLYNTNQIGDCTITSVPYQPNEAQTIQMLDNRSQINLNNWPYETQEIKMQNDSIIQHKAQTLGTNSLKTQNSKNNFVVSNDNIKLENEPKTISDSRDVCSKKFKHQKVPTNLITIKKNKNKNIIQSYRNLQNTCYKCCKSFVNTISLDKHFLNFHKVLDTNSKTMSSVDLCKQKTEHRNTSTTTDFEKNWHSNGALEVLNIESDKPNKMNLSSATSQSNNEQTVPTFSNKSYGSVIGHSTEMKAINNHTNTIKTQNSLESCDYLCQICNMSFPFVEKLMEHIRRVHGLYRIKRAKNYIPQRVNCLVCKKNLSENSIKRHLQVVHDFGKSTVQALCVQSKDFQVSGHGYEPYRQLNEEQTEKTIIKDHQSPSDKCLINDTPSIVQINQKHCKKPYTDVCTEKFKEIKVLEPISKKILVHDDTCTDVNKPNDQTLHSCFDEMHVTSKTCTLLDQPKEVQIPKVSNNILHVEANKCLVVNFPTNKKILPTFDQITQVKPQIDIVIDLLGKKPVPFTKSETQSKPHEYANSSHSNVVQVPNENLEFQLKNSNETKLENIQENHVCKKYTKSFLKELDYKLHLKTHFPFKCDDCNMVFKSQLALNWHKQIHANVGLYVCGYVHCSHLSFICQKEYSEHLKSHVDYKTTK